MPTISTLTVDVNSNTSRFRTGITGAVAGLGALAAGAAVAFAAFEDSERAMKQTEAVLKSTGGVANVTAKEVQKLSEALSQKAGIDDEVIQAGENMLLTFKNIRNEVGQGNDIFNQASVAALDMAAGMAAASGGTVDMKATTIQLGKALNDPIAGMTALSRVGVQFSEEQQKQIEQFVKHNNLLAAQKLILGELNSQFAGSAEAQKTATGTMRVALDSLAETVGKVLAPAVTFLVEGFLDLVQLIEDNVAPSFDHIAETVTNAWNAVKPFLATIAGVLIPLFETMWHTIQDRILPVLERIKPLLIIIGAAVVLFASMILVQLALVVTAVGFVIDKFLDLVGFIRDKVVEPIVNFLGRVVSYVLDKVRPIWDTVRDAAVTAWNAILAPIQAVIDKVQTLIGWIRSAIEWLGRLFAEGGAAADVGAGTGRPGVGNPGPMPDFHTGGMVGRTGLALVHAGETITPAGMPGVTVNVSGWVGSDQQIARRVRDELVKLGKRNVSTGI